MKKLMFLLAMAFFMAGMVACDIIEEPYFKDNNNGGGKNSSTWTILQTREWMRERNVKKNYTSIQNKTVEIY